MRAENVRRGTVGLLIVVQRHIAQLNYRVRKRCPEPCELNLDLFTGEVEPKEPTPFSLIKADTADTDAARYGESGKPPLGFGGSQVSCLFGLSQNVSLD